MNCNIIRMPFIDYITVLYIHACLSQIYKENVNFSSSVNQWPQYTKQLNIRKGSKTAILKSIKQTLLFDYNYGHFLCLYKQTYKLNIRHTNITNCEQSYLYKVKTLNNLITFLFSTMFSTRRLEKKILYILVCVCVKIV